MCLGNENSYKTNANRLSTKVMHARLVFYNIKVNLCDLYPRPHYYTRESNDLHLSMTVVCDFAAVRSLLCTLVNIIIMHFDL